jgi:agmatine deiminase
VLPALSYCNFLIANNVVVAQKYYEEGMPEIIREKDENALQVLQTAFPDHRIVQINTLSLNLYGGGIHCHTRNIPAAVNNQLFPQ